MATAQNFRIKNGLEVGGQLIVNSNGQLVVSTAASDLEFLDNTKLFFGDDSDLSIYHSGSHSFIQETGTGSLYIDSSGLVIRNASNNASMIVANAGGAVSLYNNGNLKLETTADGVDVTGKIQINDANTIIEEGNSNSVRVQTNSGYIDIGPHNTSWAHIETDRARYYFNKGITVNTGLIGSYDEDLQIQRAGTTKLTVTTTGVDIVGDLTITGDLNTVNTTTLDVSDKLITAGVGGTAATNSGGGFKISGANAEFLWDNTNTQMTLNKDLKFTAQEKLRFGNNWFQNSGDNNHVHFYSANGLIPHSTTTANNSPLGTSSYRWEAVYAGVGDYYSYVKIGSAFSGVAFNSDSSIRIQRPGNAYINIKAGTGNSGGILIGDTDDNYMGGIVYNNNNDSLIIAASNGAAITLNSDRDASFHRNVTVGGDIYAADSDSSTNPSITFTGHTNTGLSVYQVSSVDRLSIITGGGQRANFGTHGVESFANVYTGASSSFRNYAGTWSATTGVTGNGFSFINSVDGTAATISAAGTAVFSGDVRADTHFNSTDTNATLSATGSGNVYLRPNGKSSTTGQVHIATSGNATFAGTVTATGGNSGQWNTAYGWGNYASAPNAPSITSTTVVNETIEIVFAASTSTGNTAATSYEVWSDGGTGSDYSLIAKIPYNDIASSMSVVDSSFDDSGTIAYRVYAIRHGAYSTAATTTRAFTMPTLDVSGMSVIPDTNNYYIQYELPTTRFIDHIEIYKDVETTSGALSRTGAALVYSGNNTSYKYNISSSDMDKYHQFWVEVVTV